MERGAEGVEEIRPLRADDAAVVAEAFTAIGWHKPAEQFLRYVKEQSAGSRACWVATVGATIAGYVTIEWEPEQALPGRRFPEIQDLNVLPPFRRRGIGSRLLDRAEEAARSRCSFVGIGVGLHAGYGPAQRLYVMRGYVPDGLGVVSGSRPVEEGEEVRVDDSLTLRFVKELQAG